MKSIKELKEELVENVFTMDDMENLLAENKFFPVEAEEAEDGDNISKYSNGKCQLWVYYTQDDEDNILVTAVKRVTKCAGNTEVDPFHTFDDLNKVLRYFYDSGKYHHWLAACLMVAFGRRISDTLSLKWSDLFLADGTTYRDRLNTLVEQKTGKTVGVRSNQFAMVCIADYCRIAGINISDHYTENIFNITSAAFRAATKQAVKEVGIDYPVSTHSFRKFYGNMMYKLHQQDADALSIIQTMFGHSDPNITKRYIGTIGEKIDKYNRDYSQYLLDCKAGKDVAYSNSPVVVLTMENLREILGNAYKSGMNNCGGDVDFQLDDMNRLLAEVDERKIS